MLLWTAPAAAQDEAVAEAAPAAGPEDLQDESLPDAARAMIDAAIAGGDADAVEAVVAAARTAFPEGSGQIDTIWQSYRAEQAEVAAVQAAAEVEAIRNAGLFDNWSGQGQIGGFQSSGNSDEFGVTAALEAKREGIDWEHRLRLSGDFRRTDGVTSREQILARYEPRFQINDRLFSYGLIQFDRNVQQGFSARYAASGGLGYRLVDTDTMDLSIKAGPAYRVTEFVEGGSSSRIAGLLGVDFDWRLTDSIKLTQDANSTVETGGEALLIVDGSNTSLNAVTGIEATLIGSLRARASWSIEYDSNPPAGSVSTDTITRFTLIYGF
ncbi:membrane protein [Aurantiacibacter marinus]|uniref:Membrane protein n=2 Tax=Aurantiacibacter marinus TaxID=874156 RepID=A0A0H0XPA2_9SPHN|nr:membrane protein [Aurantiacibacter marinus]